MNEVEENRKMQRRAMILYSEETRTWKIIKIQKSIKRKERKKIKTKERKIIKRKEEDN